MCVCVCVRELVGGGGGSKHQVLTTRPQVVPLSPPSPPPTLVWSEKAKNQFVGFEWQVGSGQPGRQASEGGGGEGNSESERDRETCTS